MAECPHVPDQYATTSAAVADMALQSQAETCEIVMSLADRRIHGLRESLWAQTALYTGELAQGTWNIIVHNRTFELRLVQSQADCTVCYTPTQMRLACCHPLCVECARKWRQRAITCPCCVAVLVTRRTRTVIISNRAFYITLDTDCDPVWPQ